MATKLGIISILHDGSECDSHKIQRISCIETVKLPIIKIPATAYLAIGNVCNILYTYVCSTPT